MVTFFAFGSTQALAGSPLGTFNLAKTIEFPSLAYDSVGCDAIEARYVQQEIDANQHCEMDVQDRVQVSKSGSQFEVSFVSIGNELSTCLFMGKAIFNVATKSLKVRVPGSSGDEECTFEVQYASDLKSLNAQASPACQKYCGNGAPLSIRNAIQQ